MSSTVDPLHPSIHALPHTPFLSDNHPTATAVEQEETEQLIEALLDSVPPLEVTAEQNGKAEAKIEPSNGDVQKTSLRTAEHQKFLASTLFRLPAPYVALDASRPWLVYWTVHSLDILGIGLDDELRARAVSTLIAFLSLQGGFAGGAANTQSPHLLPTYASTCSLAIVGNSGPTGGWDKLAENRQVTYDFFMRCKQPDGGFVVCKGGEVDVRGTYCLLVVATLLDLLTPELLHNVDKFIASTQTYEGGFANATFPLKSFSPVRSPATAEAHGGYTSCSLLAYYLLASVVPLPSSGSEALSLGRTFPAPIDVESALRWSVLMQGEAIEAGGFRGRSNKLVDGCYSWWVGGGFPVLDALAKNTRQENVEEGTGQLFNDVVLQEFVLLAAQREEGQGGGLRDKPGKRPDLYHTCNNLSGLAIAQHHMVHSTKQLQENKGSFDTSKGFPAVTPTNPEGGWKSEEERQAVRGEVWSNALAWVERSQRVVGGKENRVHATTPVFNIVPGRLKPFINYFYGQT